MGKQCVSTKRPTEGKINFKEPKRFWSKVDVDEADECWAWLAGKATGAGYGAFSIHGRSWLAHRVAWVLTYGPIPEGLYICHHCDNPGCCNPYHLFLGTPLDNLADASRKGRLSGSGGPTLTADDVLDIRQLYAEGDWTYRELAVKWEVHPQIVRRALTGERWIGRMT